MHTTFSQAVPHMHMGSMTALSSLDNFAHANAVDLTLIGGLDAANALA